MLCALQTAASRCDLQGTLSRLFKEPLESLTSKVSGAQFQNLEQQMEQLDDIFTLLEQQPYAGSPAVRWVCVLTGSKVICGADCALRTTPAALPAWCPFNSTAAG
jgi:hypothetical protein